MIKEKRGLQLIMPADQPQLVYGPGPKPLPLPKVTKGISK